MNLLMLKEGMTGARTAGDLFFEKMLKKIEPVDGKRDGWCPVGATRWFFSDIITELYRRGFEFSVSGHSSMADKQGLAVAGKPTIFDGVFAAYINNKGDRVDIQCGSGVLPDGQLSYSVDLKATKAEVPGHSYFRYTAPSNQGTYKPLEQIFPPKKPFADVGRVMEVLML